MRNLKRALSLALAAVMVIGMMVVGAGAAGYEDFTDKDEIQNKDAVSMVSALGIINGLPGGSYGPTQNIDRASFAKMIALTLNGGKEPMLPGEGKVSYVDTKGTWAQQYIEFCTNLGIVAGDGTTGKFNPTAPVTISQAAKMLLVALGYNASIEGYVGYDWQVNTDSAANLAGLYKGLSGNTSANATRDQAAQLIYNALSATMVKYESSFQVDSNGSATVKPQINNDAKNGTLLENKFNAVKVTGVVMANDYAGIGRNTTDKGKTYITGLDYPSKNSAGNEMLSITKGTFTVESTTDMLGKSVTMFVQVSGSVTDTSKLTVLGGLTLTDDNKVVTLSAKKDTTDKIKSFVKDEGLTLVEYKDKDTAYSEYYVNYESQGHNAPAYNGKGMTMDFIDNDGDGDVDLVLQTIKTFGQVSSYVSTGDGTIYVKSWNPADELTTTFKSEVITSISSKDAIDDVAGFEDVKKDDYVFFYEINGTPHIEKAEYVEGTVTSKKGGDTVVIDGTSYTQSGLVKGVNEDGDSLYATITVGDEVRLYLDSAKNVVWTDAVDASTNYLFITGSDTRTNTFRDTVEAKAIFTDGSSAIIDVDVDSVKLAVDKAMTPGVYTYSKNSKDVYKLTSIPADDKDTSSVVENINGVTQGKAWMLDKGSNKVAIANGNTIFVVNRGSSYTVYTGINNVPDLKPSEKDGFKAYAVVDSGKVAKVVFVEKGDLGGKQEGVYVLDKNPSVALDKNGDEIYTYDVIYKGEKTTLTGGSKEFSDKGYFANVQVNAGEIVKVVSTSPMTPSYATQSSKSVISDKAGNVYTYTSDTIFLIVDGKDVYDASAGDVIILDEAHKDYAELSDKIVIVDTAKDGDGIADYVFICR